MLVRLCPVLYGAAIMSNPIYKISDQPTWRAAEKAGTFIGSELDIADGFIHFSTAETVEQTAALYYAGVDDLLLIAIDPDKITDALKWEAARTGELFPHLYAPLPISAVLWAQPMPVGDDGKHLFPSRFKNG